MFCRISFKISYENFEDKHKLLADKIPELLIKLIEQKNNDYLAIKNFYSYIKLTLKEILISNSYPIQLRFAAYYFKLIYKQFIIQTTARIEINKKKSIRPQDLE